MTTSRLDHAVLPGLTFAPATGPLQNRRPRLSLSGLAVIILLHALALWLLVRMNVLSLPQSLQVLTVSLIQPVVEEIKPQPRPEPDIIPPRPKPVRPRPAPTPPLPVLAAPATAAADTPVVVPEPVPAPVEPAPPAPAVVSQPRFDAAYLDNPKPPYPPLSRRMGEQGRVVLRVQVRADGSAAAVEIASSSGSPRLDEAARSTVQRWKFVPARRGAEAVPATVQVPVVFTLKESS